MEWPYHDGDPIPPGLRVESRMQRGLIAGGGFLVGVFWALGVAAANDQSAAGRWLYVPVIGPWGTLGSDKCPRDPTYDDENPCRGEGIINALLVVDGVMQALGSIMIVVGIAAPDQVLVRTDRASSRPVRHTVRLAASHLARNAFGLAAIGEF